MRGSDTGSHLITNLADVPCVIEPPDQVQSRSGSRADRRTRLLVHNLTDALPHSWAANAVLLQSALKIVVDVIESHGSGNCITLVEVRSVKRERSDDLLQCTRVQISEERTPPWIGNWASVIVPTAIVRVGE